VVAQTNLLVVSSVDESGRPSSRVMRFVTTDRPGVWYVTTAPDSPKVHEFDRGRVALITAPTPSGATINSNRVRVRRAEKRFADIADLYHAQVPGYTEGMTDDEQERELVYELTMLSAKVETWLEREVVVFAQPDQRLRSESNPEPGGQ
jgi:pyridoxine/pyridoxamine 5'-phosphate oxidase